MRQESGLSRAIYAREADRLLEWERAVAARAAYSLFVTKAEADLFASLVPSVASRIVPVGNGVDIDFFAPDRSRPSPYRSSEQAIVFTGAMDYWPNIDAATWFAREVLPTVVRSVPEARFYVVGMNPAACGPGARGRWPSVRHRARGGRQTLPPACRGRRCASPVGKGRSEQGS